MEAPSLLAALLSALLRLPNKRRRPGLSGVGARTLIFGEDEAPDSAALGRGSDGLGVGVAISAISAAAWRGSRVGDEARGSEVMTCSMDVGR